MLRANSLLTDLVLFTFPTMIIHAPRVWSFYLREADPARPFVALLYIFLLSRWWSSKSLTLHAKCVSRLISCDLTSCFHLIVEKVTPGTLRWSVYFYIASLRMRDYCASCWSVYLYIAPHGTWDHARLKSVSLLKQHFTPKYPRRLVSNLCP